MARIRMLTSASIAVRIFLIGAVASVQLWTWSGTENQHAFAADTPPAATVKLWDIASTIGHNPDPSVEDVGGITRHVATPLSPRTIVTAIENTTHPGGPCGVIFWNPGTDTFKWYGYGFGFQLGTDVNRSAAVKLSGTRTFGLGDTWLAKVGCPTFLVNFAGSDNFRFYHTSDTKGVQVDQTTGNVWYTEPFTGNMGLLDPATSVARVFAVGGTPHFVAVDSAGRAYAPVSNVGGVDQVVRVDPATNEVRRWAIPGGGLSGAITDATTNGIAIDAVGHVWFLESSSNEIGRLDPGSNGMCEFTKPGISNPQMVATNGIGSTLQAFFTEGTGDAVGVLTQSAAVGACVTVTPVVQALAPSTPTLATTDFTEEDGLSGCPCAACRSPLTAVITPTSHTILGVDPSGIIRFPFSTASPPPPHPVVFASGMTRVVLPNTVFGSDLFNHHVFQVTSPAIIAPPVVAQTTGNITGGGTIPSTIAGAQANFGFIAQRPVEGGPVSGNLEYQDPGANLNVHSIALSTFGVNSNTASFSGTATINGSGSFGFTVTVQDIAEPGTGVDTFAIALDSGYSNGGTLTGGNIQVH